MKTAEDKNCQNACDWPNCTLPKCVVKSINENALQYAREHSVAPDKETPDWIVTDFKSGYVKAAKDIISNINEISKYAWITQTDMKLINFILKELAKYETTSV